MKMVIQRWLTVNTHKSVKAVKLENVDGIGPCNEVPSNLLQTYIYHSEMDRDRCKKEHIEELNANDKRYRDNRLTRQLIVTSCR